MLFSDSFPCFSLITANFFLFPWLILNLSTFVFLAFCLLNFAFWLSFVCFFLSLFALFLFYFYWGIVWNFQLCGYFFAFVDKLLIFPHSFPPFLLSFSTKCCVCFFLLTLYCAYFFFSTCQHPLFMLLLLKIYYIYLIVVFVHP